MGAVGVGYWSRLRWLKPFAAVVLVTSSFSSLMSAETKTYIYDTRGRVIRVEVTGGPSSGTTTAYGYDAAENRTSVTVTLPPPIVIGPCTVSVAGGSMLPGTFNTGPASVGISRSGDCSSPTVVNYITRDGTAFAPGAYQATSGSLTLTSESGLVPVAAGPESMSNQFFYVDVSVVSGSGSPATLTATIAFESP